MPDSLFPDLDPPPVSPPPPPAPKRGAKVQPAAHDPALRTLAAALPPKLRLGTSSWTYAGWVGTVWDQDYPDSKLSKYGLGAYVQHPLFRTVSLDRAFYRPLDLGQYGAYATQVPEDFRFVVKAPSRVADAMVRDESGRGMQMNAEFLDPSLALRSFVEPATEGLGCKLGALVFQLSPLPGQLLLRIPDLVDALYQLLRSLPKTPGVAVAVEVRDRQWLTPEFVAALRATGATYCMGLHAKMPRIDEQLPILRALWPGPLVCRWNLNPLHGAFGYEDARRQYEPYDRLQDPDLETRAALAKLVAGVTGRGQPAYVTVSNKAEGSAPLSVLALAEALRAAGPA
ncbi:DUF72 domain-containing protein [Solimonas sp. K1W22B-7]|uniref:DUF72 domain-containing protein n=1 Tax=Solimonas sp. K1W22B-7 TaxID=2303331 RepID=UPI000E3345AF|nr:DUF72 domain-containing protein [Solimonas sp. K1W22B-7]AXQ29420.1 DUF72 domain-containing protein [Solimonas sp. K1W22B-7]